jgi:hypothetical protein
MDELSLLNPLAKYNTVQHIGPISNFLLTSQRLSVSVSIPQHLRHSFLHSNNETTSTDNILTYARSEAIAKLSNTILSMLKENYIQNPNPMGDDSVIYSIDVLEDSRLEEFEKLKAENVKLNKEYNRDTSTIIQLSEQLEEFKNMTLWKRIKAVFIRL